MCKYDDIINLPHHVSKIHKKMSLQARAAQFSPFAALAGYSDEIKETARLTDKRIDIDDNQKNIINNKLQFIIKNIKDKPLIRFTYFIYDNKKQGGKYVKITGIIKKIDLINNCIILYDKTKIDINEIINIEGSIFEIFE